MKNFSSTDKVSINSIPIIASRKEDFIKETFKILQAKKSASVLTCTTYGLYRSTQNKLLNQALISSDAVVPDGMPLVWILKAKQSDSERIYGPDLVRALCQKLQNTQHSHYFYGSTQPTTQILLENLTREYPNIDIAGSHSPSNQKIGQIESRTIIHQIQTTKPSIIWIGLGEEKQDIWIHNHKKYFPNSVIIGVGAAFDFLAGTKNQAPKILQKIGLEWLYRLLQEPKRLRRRYFHSGLFLIKYAISSK